MKKSLARTTLAALLVIASVTFTAAVAWAADDATLAAGTPSANAPEWAVDDGARGTSLSAQANLPAKYDMRSFGLVTPVKQQEPWTSCWAFGGIAAAESSIISSTGGTYANTKIDLSERHLINFAMTPITTDEYPAQAGEGVYPLTTGANAAFSAGGRSALVTSLFASGIGPVAESAFPYRGKNAILAGTGTQRTYSDKDDWSIPAINADGSSNRFISGEYTLKDGNVLPSPAVREIVTTNVGGAMVTTETWKDLNPDGMRAMKQEILNGHGVSIALAADTDGKYAVSSPSGGDLFAQYTFDDNVLPNHGVCIVGWDDTYSKDNFTHNVYVKDDAGKSVLDEEATLKTTPAGDGAWICKNSWGSQSDAGPDDLGNTVNYDDYGIRDASGKATGYFYLSYYDRSFDQPETMEFSTNLDSDDGFYALRHSYMPAQNGYFVDKSNTTMSSANVFTPETKMDVKSISATTAEANTRVTFAVYKLNANATDPTNGTMVYRSSRNFEYAGFHRVDLEQTLTFAKGQKFSVVTTTYAVGDDGARSYSVAANRGFSKAQAQYMKRTSYSVAVVNDGESYLYKNGTWIDWNKHLATLEILVDGKPVKDPGTGKNILYCQVFPVDNFGIGAYAVPSKLVHFKAVAATRKKAGNIEHWYDEQTGKYYKDADGTTAISKNDTIIPAIGGIDVGKTATAGSGKTRAKYTATSETTVTYKVVSPKTRTAVSVPSKVTINGKSYKVTKIANKAFKGSAVKSIAIGSYVTTVYSKTFYGAKQLKTLTLGKNVKKIAASAFSTNNALRILKFNTTKLAKKSAVKNCLKGSNVTQVRVSVGYASYDAKYVKKYKKLFAVKNPISGKKVTVK